MPADHHGPNQQSMTGVTFYCGADANEFLGAHNPECPYWHPCDCSPKHSSLPDCHRCQCTGCWMMRAWWAERIRIFSRAALIGESFGPHRSFRK